jgi:hypothetical protein
MNAPTTRDHGVIMAKRRTTKRADHGLIRKANNRVLKRSKVPPPGQYRVAALTAPPNWAEMVAKDPEGPEIQRGSPSSSLSLRERAGVWASRGSH